MFVVVFAGTFVNLVFTYIFAGLVLVLAIIHLFLHLFRLKYSKYAYFLEFQNWNELLLFPLSATFVFIFANDCGCPKLWQWQIGIFAVFLAFINLLSIASEIPNLGTFVIVFKEILVTFLKLTIFTLILVVGFSLILLMMFFGPEAQVSYCMCVTTVLEG